jgi:5'-deoxynucleotidase YfbR-like HD superfamily hydrolase
MQSGGAPLASPSKNDPRPIEDLIKAAQRLRDATHDMVREQAITKRNDSIGQVDKTLNEVEDAMIRLPTSLLLADTNESDAKKSTANLASAADRLNEAVKALKEDGASGSGAVDVKKIKQALAQIHEDRMNVPSTVSMSGSAK